MQTLLALGEKKKDAKVMEEAVNRHLESKDAPIHRQAIVVFNVTMGGDRVARHIAEYHARHGDTDWLQARQWPADRDELLTLLSAGMEAFRGVTDLYSRQGLPFCAMPKLLSGADLATLWTENQSLGLPLLLESGNPQELAEETTAVREADVVAVDATALLLLQECGILSLLPQMFSKVVVYRPIFLQLLQEVLSTDGAVGRSVIDYCRRNSSFKFAPRTDVAAFEPHETEALPDSCLGVVETCRQRGLLLLAGDRNFRAWAASHGVRSAGTRAVIEAARDDGLLAEGRSDEIIAQLLKRNARFVSFRPSTLLLETYRAAEEGKLRRFAEITRRELLSPHADPASFINVYLNFAQQLLARPRACPYAVFWYEFLVSVAKDLGLRAAFHAYLATISGEGEAARKGLEVALMLDYLSLRFLFELAVIIHAAPLDREHRDELLDAIRRGANLERWLQWGPEQIDIIGFLLRHARHDRPAAGL